MRTEACFYSDSLEGEFTGGDVLCDDRGYCGQGVAQGGIVDTPDGKWYAMLFQDSGAVGRIPILLPVTWKDHFPVFGQNGHVPEEIEVHSTRPGYIYQPLVEVMISVMGCFRAGSLIMIQIHGTIIWMHCRNLYNYNTGSLYRAYTGSKYAYAKDELSVLRS